ncbi:MAG: hypothetical protein WDZ30_06870 [Cellvibrionaceae bacterium]
MLVIFAPSSAPDSPESAVARAIGGYHPKGLIALMAFVDSPGKSLAIGQR